VSTLLHATVYMFLHNLLNALVQIANKMGLQKNIVCVSAVMSQHITQLKIQVCLMSYKPFIIFHIFSTVIIIRAGSGSTQEHDSLLYNTVSIIIR
jgi:hypothetical protein